MMKKTILIRMKLHVEPADLEGMRVQYGFVRVEVRPGVHLGLEE